MLERQPKWILYTLLLITAFSFRLYVARRLANDTPGDGKVYARMARNLLEQHVYSHSEQPPYEPSLIRLPGYTFFLAAIYSVFGHDNNGAVRVVQALIDSLTCGLAALLAYCWEPDERRKPVTAGAALALAAVCPFTAIYVGTILTEVWASFLLLALCLLATLAFRAHTFTRSLWGWAAVGLVGGIAVFFRPDSSLFVAAVGLTLLFTELFRQQSASEAKAWRPKLARIVAKGTVLSAAFVLLLIPWTIRNWRTFHLFQPLSPAHGEMPGEFVPRGYYTWVRTWVDDGRYVEPVLWSLDSQPIDIDEMPDSAFDSAEEKARVAALLEQYNDPPQTDEPEPAEEPSPSPEPSSEPGRTEPSSANQQLGRSPVANDTENDEAAADEETEDQSEEQQAEEPTTPEMTPPIDAAFGQIARERIARAPLRYYVRLPLKRAWALWFGPHSDYYPFTGELFPLEDLDHTIHQHIWLPLLTVLVVVYTLLGIGGGWCLWRARDFASRRWLLLAVLLIFIRLAFFSTMENPEPRYTVEFFPLLAVLGGIAISHLPKVRRT